MFRLKPMAWWVLPWGLLAGLLISILFVRASTNWKSLPSSDCGQAGSFPISFYAPRGGCVTLEEGYPVKFLSTAPLIEADPGAPARDATVGAEPNLALSRLAADWLIWSLVSCLIFYYLSSPRGARRHLPDAGTPSRTQVRPDTGAEDQNARK
jgi:hypothetical protein